MKKLLFVVVVLLIALLMVFTNPDKNSHQKAMMKAVKEYVQEEATDRLGNNMFADISSVLANNAIKAYLNYKIKLQNYYLFSTTSMRIDGKEQLMSVGLFGHVFTFDKDLLKERLQKAENFNNEE